MKAIKLMVIQIISLLAVVASADRLMEEIPSSITFLLGFAIFATTSIYINRNEEKLLDDINRLFDKKEEAEKCI